MEPEDLAVIGHTGDLLVDIYARNLTHIYILPQCSTTAARVLNPAGMDAQFERLRCAISRGILTEVLHDRVKVSDVQPITEKEYYVRDCTALLDAVGGAIHHIGNIHKYARPEDVPEHTLFVITTDGMENASRRYSARRVKEMIQRQKEKYGWEFLFLGANIDAVETAGHLGITPDRAVNYHCDSEGTRLNYEVVGQAVAAVRCSAPLDEHWKDAIEEDFRKRQKRR